jgi:hypothetical protein
LRRHQPHSFSKLASFVQCDLRYEALWVQVYDD